MPKAELGPIADFPPETPVKASGGGRDFVVVRRGEGAFVLDLLCQHLGAPLSDGVVYGDELVCPWHRACYALGDGARQEPPGLNQQRAYDTVIEDGVLFALWGEKDAPHPAPAMALRGTEKRRIAVLGAGAAGITAAETLRMLGFAGELVLADRETASPYDRTKLSKGLTEEAEAVRLRSEAWLEKHDVKIRRGEVTGIDLSARTLSFSEGEAVEADALILAPGAAPRRLGIPGEDLPRVMTLRSAEDGAALTAALKGTKRAAIVGSGFIGMELAAVLSGEGIRTTVIARDEAPFAKVLGERLARRLKAEHEEAGVVFIGGAEAAEIEGEESPRAVILKDGRRIEADLVLVAIGVSPRTDLLSGVERDEDGGITVAPDLSLPGTEGVRLAGDIARVPTPWGAIRVEHWRWAQQLGGLAARSLLEEHPPAPIAPFFWTKQQAQGSYAYIGHAERWDEIVYEGEPDGGAEFAAFYLEAGRVMAVFGHGMADRLSVIERRMAAEGPLAAGTVIG